jgi:hypothetical protein
MKIEELKTLIEPPRRQVRQGVVSGIPLGVLGVLAVQFPASFDAYWHY